MKKCKMLFIRHNCLVFGLLISALFLRGIYPSHTVIGFDQVQILENANLIIAGDFTLIGPRTGPADMFTGPLIYYLSAPFIFVFGDVRTITLVPLFLSLITGIIMYVLLHKYVGKKEAMLGLTLWSFSPFLIDLDRTLWNPNLSILAASLLFFPLLAKKHDKHVMMSLFFGAFLSYQAHFSGFLMIGIASLIIIIFKKPKKLLIFIVSGLLLSLLPTILFDLRNNFLNAHGLIKLFAEKSGAQLLNFIFQLLQNSIVIARISGSFFFTGISPALMTMSGFIIAITAGIAARRNKKVRQSFIWIGITSVILALYRGDTLEYYFMLLIPALIFIFAILLSQMNQKIRTIFLAILIAYSCYFTATKNRGQDNLTLEVLSNITAQLENEQVKTIVYDIYPGGDFGAKYFFRNIPFVPNGKIIHITYPNTYHFSELTHYGNVAVWADPRIGNNNYITTDSYILSSIKTVYLKDQKMISTTPSSYDYYLVMQENVVVGHLSISKIDNQETTWLNRCMKITERKSSIWVAESTDTYFMSNARHCLFFESSRLSPEFADISIY